MIISFNFLSFLMLTFFIASGVSEAHASPSRVSLDCKLKIFEEKKWQSVDSSLFSNQSVDTYESARQPDRLYFKFENKIYTGLKSCFIDVSPTENAGAAEKTALDSTSEALKPEHRENWTMFFGLGSTLSPKTSHAVTIAGITGNSNESGSAAVAFNFEALYHFSNYFGLSAIIESNKYIYQGGPPEVETQNSHCFSCRGRNG